MTEPGSDLQRLWSIFVDVWRNGVYGVDVADIFMALVLVMITITVRRLFARIVTSRLRGLARLTKTTLDDAIADAVEPPLRMVPVVLGVFFAADVLNLSPSLAQGAENLTRSLIVYTLFLALYRLITPMSQMLSRLEEMFGAVMIDWLVRVVRVALVVLGAATILEVWGINVAALIAGFGLFGVAVALGAQDLFKNLISGILILAERRFVNGDWIRVDGVIEGTVERLGFRSTLIRRFDMAPVQVPNSELSDHPVINFSRMTHRRIYWTIGLEYRTSVEQLREVRDGILSYLSKSEDILQPPAGLLFVRVDSFNDSSIDLMIYCFAKTTAWGEWLRVKEDLAFEIKRIVDAAGTGFAFPSRSIYIENNETPPTFKESPAETATHPS